MPQETSYEDYINIVNAYSGLLVKVCRVYAENTEDRKDLFQDIVLQCWLAFPRFRNESKISTWLYRIALNTAISNKRKRSKRIQFANEAVADYAGDAASPPMFEEYETLMRIINALPDLEKALILLYLEDQSYQEIADIMGMTVTNVGSKLSRIKEKLRKMAKPQL
jgi:RNA polymerase sigma-70 factor (ECF subfamily)